MTDRPELESLYREAQSAIKAREYDRAGGLLKQILVIDENYKDASRLLAQAVKLKRRRWYNHPALWSALGLAAVIGLGIWLAPKISLPITTVPTSTFSSVPTILLVPLTPTRTVIPSKTSTLTPTPIPLAWKRLSMGQEFERDEITAIYQNLNDEDLLYIRTSRAGIYKSINGGASWQPTTDSMPEIEVGLGNPEMRLPGDCVILVINKDDPRIAYCGIEKGIYRTSDAGNNWDLSNPRVGLVKTIVISPHDPQVIFASGQGFSISEDGGQTWEQFNNGIPNIPVELKLYPKDPSNLFAQDMTSSGSPIFRSTNSGLTWNLLRTDSCALLFDAEGNPTCGFWKSYNGGTTWINIFYSKILGYAISGYPSTIGANYPYSSTSLVFFPGVNPKFYVTHDLGKTWKYFTESYGWGYDLRFFFDQENGQVIYAFEIQGTATPDLYRSNDFGETWKSCSSLSEISGPYTGTPLAVDYDDSNHLLLASQGSGVWVSEDGCQSWKKSNRGLANLYVNTVSGDPNNPNVFYAGTDGGAYVSFDFGQTWNQVNEGLLGATVVYSIVADKDSNVYAATPYGIFKLESK